MVGAWLAIHSGLEPNSSSVCREAMQIQMRPRLETD